MAEGFDYDALIVGARVAGSSLAIRLAQQGRRVLLVDRDTFPSDTVSTHGLGFPAVDSLRRLGVLERVEAAGFRRLYRHRVWLGDVFLEGPAGPPGTYSLAPRRAVLDHVLIERAVECGARFTPRARVDGLLFESGSVTGAVIQHIGGERIEVRARVVVGADGKTSQVAKWVGAEKYDGAHEGGRPIYYGYFSGVAPLPEPAIEVFFGKDRVGFCMAMRPDEHILIVEAQPQEFEAIRQDARAWLLDACRAQPGMAGRMAGARLEDGRVLGIRGVDNHFRKPYGDGWALTGDAAYVKDPITAYGVGDALLQGFMLARSLGEWFDGAAWEPTMAAYHERRDAAFRALYEQTVAAVGMHDDDDHRLDALRAAMVSPHDVRLILRALPGLLDQVFDPMAQFRHAFVQNLFEATRETSIA